MMQQKIAHKLFGAFFLILAIVVGAMFLSRYIFTLNFQYYINQVELEKLETLLPILQDEYRSKGSWAGIRDNIPYWTDLLDSMADTKKDHPPPEPGRPDLKRIPRILMIDAQSIPLLGIPEEGDEPRLVEIVVDGKKVGWLGLKKHKPFRSGPPASLMERQAKHLTFLGLCVIGLTALIAFLFSRHLIKPVRQLMMGTRELANRNFSVRIKPTTRDELGQLAENFNQTARTLEKYENLRRQWLTDISHELRTPLAILRGEAEAIHDGVRPATTENIASLYAEILRMNKLVEDLHLLSITESGSLEMRKEPCSPKLILEDTLDGYRSRIAHCGLDLLVMLDDIGGFFILGDADRLDQVFINILENGCKYVRSGERIRVSGTVTGRTMNILFEDSGPGVPADEIPHLFDRLYRGETSRSRDLGGSGLGLSICQHIIESHGGSIWAENNQLGGLSIGMSLPLFEQS